MEESRETLRAHLTAEATRRFGAERAAALGRDIDALAADLARVATAEVPDETEPAFFLLEGDA
jgi:plasmid stability protein